MLCENNILFLSVFSFVHSKCKLTLAFFISLKISAFRTEFEGKFHIYLEILHLEILRTATDILLYALRRHYYLALILFTRNVESIAVLYTWC